MICGLWKCYLIYESGFVECENCVFSMVIDLRINLVIIFLKFEINWISNCIEEVIFYKKLDGKCVLNESLNKFYSNFF